MTRRRPDGSSSSVPSARAEFGPPPPRAQARGFPWAPTPKRHPGQTVVMALVETSRARDWRTFAAAAVVSVVTMPLTAMWFLLIGGALLVAGDLVPATVRRASRLGTASLVGLGLLVGPAIYIALALVQ